MVPNDKIYIELDMYFSIKSLEIKIIYFIVLYTYLRTIIWGVECAIEPSENRHLYINANFDLL